MSLKRRAIQQLDKENFTVTPTYEERPMSEENSPQKIQKRRIFRARRPLRQPQFQENTQQQFRLQKSLISQDLERQLLQRERRPILFTNAQPAQVTQKKWTPFNSNQVLNSFQSILYSMTQQSEDQLTFQFLQSATISPRKLSPQIIKLNGRISNQQKTYHTVFDQKCIFQLEGVDKGPGNLQIMIGFFQKQPFSLLVFRSFNTRVLYCGNISKVSKVKHFENLMLIDGDDYSMLEIECLSKSQGLKHEFCQISLRHDLLPELKETIDSIKNYIELFSTS